MKFPRVDRDTLDRLLLGAEAEVAKGGWDQPSCLAVVEWTAFETWAVASLPMQIADPPSEFLRYLADRFMASIRLTTGLLENCPGFYGTAFISEGWQGPPMTPAALRTFAEEGKSFADVPGSLEVRQITVVTLYGEALMVQRVRGREPKVFPVQLQVVGDVPESLRLMTLAVAKQMPDNAEYVALLHDLHTRVS